MNRRAWSRHKNLCIIDTYAAGIAMHPIYINVKTEPIPFPGESESDQLILLIFASATGVSDMCRKWAKLKPNRKN